MSISIKKRQEIENLALLVRIKFNVETPVDIFSFVNLIGGRIEIDPALLEPEVIPDQDGFIIRIRETDKRKQKSEIAHALGYIFWHLKYLEPERAENEKVECSWENPVDEECLVFARTFLMPPEEFIRHIREHAINDSINLKYLADTFDVPHTEIINQGTKLKIFL